LKFVIYSNPKALIVPSKMAAPAEKTVKSLTGVYTMNKVDSDPTDPILQLQGVGWIVRKVIANMTVTLKIDQKTDADGTETITITQPGAGGFSGTTETRHIPQGDEKEWNDHKDHVFGHVKGYTVWRKLSELSDEDEDDAFLKEGWEEAETYIESYVESQGNGWVARQLWGFAETPAKASGGAKVRRYTRRVVVKKGSEIKKAVLTYDYVGPLDA